jgi:hypothetical protein
MTRNLHPSLRNLKFAGESVLKLKNILFFLLATIVLICFFEKTVTCSSLFSTYSSSNSIKLSIQNIGSLINNIYVQPLIFLQMVDELDFLFIFLNVHKNICVRTESIFLNGFLWVAILASLTKIYLALKYLTKLAVYKFFFKVIRVSSNSNFGKKIAQFFYPKKDLKPNFIFIFAVIISISSAQIKMVVMNNIEHPQLFPYQNIYLSNLSSLKKLDQRVFSIASTEKKNIYTLSKALTNGLQTDLEKIYVIHKWVTNNISYDTKSYFAKDVKNTTLYGYNTSDLGHANAALEKRLAVCDGYSELVLQLGLAANLSVEKITGYVNDSYFGNKKEDRYHAWNAVKIDGAWYLMDATWDAGSVGEDELFRRNSGEYKFFLIDPNLFKETHTPELKRWLLLG